MKAKNPVLVRSIRAAIDALDTMVSSHPNWLQVQYLADECAERYAWSSDPRYMIKDLNPVGLPGDRFYGPMFIDEGMCDFSETMVLVKPWTTPGQLSWWMTFQSELLDQNRSGPKHLQISVLRGVGKSWLTAAFVLWTPVSLPTTTV